MLKQQDYWIERELCDAATAEREALMNTRERAERYIIGCIQSAIENGNTNCMLSTSDLKRYHIQERLEAKGYRINYQGGNAYCYWNTPNT